MLFVHLLINYVILTLRNIEYQFYTNLTQSHYVKLTFKCIKNSTQKS